MSIYKTVEEVLIRDYEITRSLSSNTLDKIVADVMEELAGYENEQCTEQFIYQVAGELLSVYIFKGVTYGIPTTDL